MNQYTNAGIYIALGLIGAVGHYVKKKYIDKTTDDTFSMYVLGNFPHTLQSVGAIAFAEINLSFLQTTDVLSLQSLIGAITAGYMFDSGINKASDSEA